MKLTEISKDSQLRRFDLNLLLALDVLLDERNITHAATRLSLSQPAMSGVLQRLRDFFEDQLLVRVGREMEPTPLALSLSQPVKHLLSDVRRTIETRPHFDPATAKRVFNIAMSDYASFVIMPKVISALSAAAPFISCFVEPMGEAYLQRLESNDIEMCVVPDDRKIWQNIYIGAPMRTEPLFTDEFICVCDANNPEIGDSVSLDQYRKLHHGMAHFGDNMSSIVEFTLGLHNIDVQVTTLTASFSSLLLMLPGTPLIATVQARLARKLASSLPLKLLPSPVPMPVLREVLIWHGRNELDPAHQFVRNIFLEAAKEVMLEP